MKKNVLISAIIIVCIGGFFWYKNYTSSPEYIIKQIVSAYGEKNLAKFENYFDIDEFSTKLYTNYQDWSIKNSGIFNPMSNSIDSADALKINLKNIISGKKNFNDLDSSDETSVSSVSFAKLIDKFHSPRIQILSESENEKKVKITVKTYDEQEFDFELLMKNSSGKWKISELVNVGEVCIVYKDFAKNAILSYLKEVQPIQDKYLEMTNKANKLPTSGSTREESTTLLENFCLAKKQAEDYRMEELSKVETNPFSNIVNTGRIMYSKNASQWFYYRSLYARSLIADKSKSYEYEKTASDYENKAKEFNSGVNFLIDYVGYKK